MRKSLISVFLLTICANNLPAGVIILAKAPQAIKKTVTKAQKIVEEYIKQLNAYSQERFLFEKNKHAPHITLAYISNEKMSLEELHKAEPNLHKNLIHLAQNHEPFRISCDSKEVHFQGKFQKQYGKLQFKKYIVLVLKIKPSQELLNLVAHLKTSLEKYAITQQWLLPFNPHITIGYLYDKKDIDPTPALEHIKSHLQKCFARLSQQHPHFTIDFFVLCADDQKEQKYYLNKL